MRKRTLQFFRKIVRRYERHHHNMHALLTSLGIILFWRGIWDFSEIIFSQDKLLRAIVCTGFGLFILWFPDDNIDELEGVA